MLNSRIAELLENELEKIYDELGIKSGDITPRQYLRFTALEAQTAALFAELIKQNADGRVFRDTEYNTLVTEKQLQREYYNNNLCLEYETFSDYVTACQVREGGTLEEV